MEIRRLLLDNKFIYGAYIIYIDDTLLGAASKELAWANHESYLARMKALGILINDKKTVPPCQELPFTGVVLNTKGAFIALTAERQAKLKKYISDFLAERSSGNGYVRLGVLDTLTGKLGNAAYVFNLGRSALAPLYEAKNEVIKPNLPYPPIARRFA
jgi:hypothetical protein